MHTYSTGLIVRVLLSAYTSTMVSDAAVLHTKLQNVLPSTWCMSFLPGVSPVQSTLALYKLMAVPQSLTADVMFMLSIAHDCSWTLSAAVNVEHCRRLSGVPSRFSCADELEVSKLLSALDGSSLCIGNPDVKFMGLLMMVSKINLVKSYIFSDIKQFTFAFTVKNDLLKIIKNLLTPTSAKMLLFQDVFLLILVCPTTN